MKVGIVYEVQGHGIVIQAADSNHVERARVFSAAHPIVLDKIDSGDELISTQKDNELGLNESYGYYYVVKHENIRIIVQVKNFWHAFVLFRIPFFGKFNRNRHIRYGMEKASLFRLWARENLLDVMLSKSSDIRDQIEAFKKYIFFDDYSFWEYNAETKTFTKVCSSIDHAKNFIEESEGSTFNEVLDADYSHELREVRNENICGITSLSGKYVFRMKLRFGSAGDIGILNFYTSKRNFGISDKTYTHIKNYVESRYSSQLINHQRELINLNEFIAESARRREDLIRFFTSLSEKIADELYFEACSIFLYLKDVDALKLIATKDRAGGRVPENDVLYPLTMNNSLTIKVYSGKKSYWSYDLRKDSNNSKHYSERTTLPPKNWIGVPIVNSFSGEAIGVIRIKNKYSWSGKEKRSREISPGDFRNIEAIALHVGNYVSLKTVLSTLEESNSGLTRFLRIMKHEIRAPIVTFSNSPEIIKDLLNKEVFNGRDKVYMLLGDIQAMGARLKFLTDTYSFKEMKASYDPKKISLLEDVYYPVMNIAKRYYEKVVGVRFSSSHFEMNRVKVFADRNFCNIAFNAAIDNAAKYAAEEDKIVIIYGKNQEPGFFDLVVENNGLGVLEDEAEEVFKEGVRGRQAREMNVPGYGIGLSVSRELMRHAGGDVFIEHGMAPFRLVIRIPLGERDE